MLAAISMFFAGLSIGMSVTSFYYSNLFREEKRHNKLHDPNDSSGASEKHGKNLDDPV